ncbi:hypothetical protein SmaMPs15_000071 [Stenotrophomonas maltophilia phage vB_SmaM_Ps15]|uniref:Uncharacterized protein n=1 Tax=Stenotrophomonas maltophilia phage vB_SmaM_Ps15 TaxID=3071007 RepID=A0AAE9JUX2_9CAUD|nr:hypothetical protein PQC01_gp071 [Stenotrophomonas maltophilia phage vB_SmaM_Ps15]UMO77222.1 hypothetical protein SmaMPs15_000071 [Stenotrophomonas maltophilia phage vB_SmaM_Ps15]
MKSNQDKATELLGQARAALDNLREHLAEVYGDHQSIRASDDQYEDMEMSWTGGALHDLDEAIKHFEDVEVTIWEA